MILIAAVSDDGGMMFNGKRQSQDKALRERVLGMSRGSRLWMSEYTAGQFLRDGPLPGHAAADGDFARKAGTGEYCFLEGGSAARLSERLEGVVLFRWNRKYPSDQLFDIDLAGGGWRLLSAEDFAGSSHERITMEVYERCETC